MHQSSAEQRVTATPNISQDLRTCDEFSGFRTISRGLRPREIVQLRKSYQFSETVLQTQSSEALSILGLAIQNRQSKIQNWY